MATSTPKQYRLNNLTGGINTTAEENALASFDYKGLGVQAEARDIENYTLNNRGGIRKAKGFSEFYDTTVTEPITGLYRYIQADGTSYLVYSQEDKVYDYNGGTPTDIGATITSGEYVHFETANDYLIISDGVLDPVKWDGSAVTAIGAAMDVPPTGTRQTLWAQNRLWAFSDTEDTSNVFYTDALTTETGWEANFVPCDVSNGQKIVAIGQYFVPGNFEPIIIVLKERSVGAIIGDGSDANPYSYVAINQDTGGSAFRGLVQFGQDVAYLTPRGVTSYKTDNQIVNLIYYYLSEKVRTNFQALNAATLDASIAWYDWKHTRISFAVPEATQTTPNVIYHYDTRFGAWYKERWAIGQDCTASLIDTDGTWYHGDSNGKIYVHSDEVDNFDGQPINAFWKTGHMDFGSPTAYKHLRLGRMMIRGNGEYALGVSTMLDYGIRNGTAHSLNLTGGAYYWGGGTWTSDPSVYQWGGAPIKFPKFFPGGDFLSMQLILTQGGADQPVDIFELEFDVEVTGLR